ncbi:MAG: PTS sugar transporter subunit IIC [Spirochaetaceae bacterium]|nr:PTS sugar transporter subunit IIC [Spirochaetaceae bacterium]
MNFLHRKNVVISVRRYFIDAMGAMALGLFSSLLVGMIVQTAGNLSGVQFLVDFGQVAIKAMGPAICIAVAYGLQAPPLVIFSSVAVGIAAVGAGGGPAGCYLAAVVAAECGKLVSKETKLDIIVTPVTTLFAGVAVAIFVGPHIGSFMTWLGSVIEMATNMQPIPMGLTVAVLMGLTLTSPISSAAIAMMLGLSGLAAGAATAGCAAQMIGFAVISYRDNGISGLAAQGLGTSMLQIPNVVRNPLILIPPTVAGAILGMLSTTLVPMQNVPEGAGMGTCGLVGQIGTVSAMGFSGEVIIKIVFMHFILPAVISFVVYTFMRKKGLIKDGDMKLNTG